MHAVLEGRRLPCGGREPRHRGGPIQGHSVDRVERERANAVGSEVALGAHQAHAHRSLEVGPLAHLVQIHQAVAEMMAEVLAHDGARVEAVSSGREALRLLQAGCGFDVVLSDLRMPNLDGPGLYRALQSSNPALLARLAFITGDSLSPQLRRFLESTDRPCIEKPLTPDDIRRLVRAPQHKLLFDRLENRTELYDIEADPLEKTDLSQSDADLAAFLMQRLQEFMSGERQGDQIDMPSEDVLKALEELGY